MTTSTTSNSTAPLALSCSAAADRLGVSIGTVRRWESLGYLHAYRTPGNQRRFDEREVDEFAESLAAPR